MMFSRCSFSNEWKTTNSSIRFKNSGLKTPFQFIQNITLHSLPGFRLCDFLEPERDTFLNEFRSQVGRHHENGILEIDFPPQAIREHAIIQGPVRGTLKISGWAFSISSNNTTE